jgi:periplasmic protein TonB
MNFAVAGGAANHQNRAIGFAFVVGFHILLVWGLMNGLARKAVELLPAPIETKIIEEIKPPAEEPPPPKPEFEPPPPPYVPPPEISIAAPVQATTAITQTTAVKPQVAAPAPKKSVRVPPRIDLKGSSRACKEPEYPAASERLGESGTSGISLLIGADGKVQQSKVDASSGHKRLDEAAIKAFSRCKFIVGTNDGVAEASWFSIRYKWVVPK